MGRKIANGSSGNTIKMEEFEAKDNAAVVGKAEGNQQFFGGTHNWGNQSQSQKTTTSTNLNTIPPNLRNWVERKEEIETIEAWLNNPQVSTVGITQANTLGIQGLGGVGKSTLAAYFYHSLDFEAKFWADVSLKPNFTVFAEKIILALGGKVNQPIDITELINNLLQLLSQRRCLLVVDNLETLLDKERNWQGEYYQQFFSRWQQQGTNSTLFITTQDKPQLFRELQHWYTLGGMEIEEGIALLNKLAIQGTEAELKAFVEYVDGHPLTINLVAGFLREYCNSQLSKAREEFKLEEFELAYKEASGFYRNEPKARNALLSWIIKQHLARLTLEQIQFLINLSVYRLPFNHKAAIYQWIEKEIKPIVIQKKLQELCNRSLLIKTEDNKFKFESLVQKYILQQANDLTNAHQQAIEYYQLYLKDEKSWQVLDDVSEYLEIAHHQCELKQYAEANNLLDICSEFLDMRGHYSVLRDIYEKLISGWKQNLKSEERSAIANSIGKLGNAYSSLGKNKKAIKYFQNSLEIQKQISNTRRIASSLMSLGNAYNFLGEYSKGIEYNKQALEIQKQIGEHKEAAISLVNLGTAYFSLGEYNNAFKYNKLSLRIQKRIGDRDGEAGSLMSLGNIENCWGEYERAIEFYQDSLGIYQHLANHKKEANSLMGLGISYYSLKEYEQAIKCYQDSLEINRDFGNLYGEANCLSNLGIAYYYLGEYEQAIEFYQKSLKIKRFLVDHHGEANSLTNLGIAFDSLGEYEQAIESYQKSLKIAQDIGNQKLIADIYFNLGCVYENSRQLLEAKTAYKNARKLYQAIKLDKKIEECDKVIKNLENNDIG